MYVHIYIYDPGPRARGPLPPPYMGGGPPLPPWVAVVWYSFPLKPLVPFELSLAATGMTASSTYYLPGASI